MLNFLVLFLITLVLLAVAVGALFYVLNQKQIVLKEQAVAHEDAKSFQKLFTQSSGLPGSSTVFSKFAQLKFSRSRGHLLSELMERMDMDYKDLIQLVESKFIRVDQKLFHLFRLVKIEVPANLSTDEEDFSAQTLERLTTAHEKKYQLLYSKVDRLLRHKNKDKALNEFVELNEFLNSYLAQIENQMDQFRQVRDPDAFARVIGIA